MDQICILHTKSQNSEVRKTQIKKNETQALYCVSSNKYEAFWKKP